VLLEHPGLASGALLAFGPRLRPAVAGIQDDGEGGRHRLRGWGGDGWRCRGGQWGFGRRGRCGRGGAGGDGGGGGGGDRAGGGEGVVVVTGRAAVRPATVTTGGVTPLPAASMPMGAGVAAFTGGADVLKATGKDGGFGALRSGSTTLVTKSSGT